MVYMLQLEGECWKIGYDVPRVVAYILFFVFCIPVVYEQVEQTLLDYLTQVGIANNILLPTLGAAANFELRHGFLQMIESNQFHGTDSEDPVAHLKRFLQLTGTINVQNMPTEYVRLDAFPFSLNGKAWD